MDYQQTRSLDALKALPKLPKPNLDDRTYKDLVDECILRIPRYCPEWSNHNPADPGITLVELFAWLTDQMLWRFNQVPFRQYIAFLELLGIRLASPQPAKTRVTFYLSRPQSDQKGVPPIAAGTEVATERTDNQNAVIFSTERSLDIAVPHIRNFLIADHMSPGDSCHLGTVQDGFQGWKPEDDNGDRWSGRREQRIFQLTPSVNNGFYLVIGSQPLETGQMKSLAGHVISLDIQGQLAGPTGINPKRPPRRWEAWDGECWQPVLLHEEHDETFGFSFDEMSTAQRGSRQGNITLHMPSTWPEATFESNTGAPYTGFGLRCVYTQPNDPRLEGYTPELIEQSGYRRSPTVTALSIGAVGGTVPAIQCTYVVDELLGESTGKPGQQFSLQSNAILSRSAGEYLEVILPGEEVPQQWTEVEDFADSATHDLHYILDSRTGNIQLGPLIREPAQLQESVQLRRSLQTANDTPGRTRHDSVLNEDARLLQQYGQVPPKGATLRMKAYRTGGGSVGNVKPGALRILKSAVPYVGSITNHQAALGGTDAETMDQAIMRVPRLLRTRDRAVTPEDFETLTKQASTEVYRVKCSQRKADTVGKVVVLIVPSRPQASSFSQTTGSSGSERFSLSKKLRETVETFLVSRSLLGIAVQAQSPEYIRVKVKTQVSVEETYKLREQSREEITRTLQQHLYRFLNPVSGGWNGQGWTFGADLNASDVLGYLHKQQVPGVRAIGNVQLFAWDNSNEQWMLNNDGIALTPSQLIDSWESEHHSLDSHVVELV